MLNHILENLPTLSRGSNSSLLAAIMDAFKFIIVILYNASMLMVCVKAQAYKNLNVLTILFSPSNKRGYYL